MIELPYIPNTPQTAKLYQLEEKRKELNRAIAKEYARLLEHTKEEFWTKTMPEVLLSFLHNYAPSTALPAAEAYVALHKK